MTQALYAHMNTKILKNASSGGEVEGGG
jgi:hypothetical protein